MQTKWREELRCSPRQKITLKNKNKTRRCSSTSRISPPVPTRLWWKLNNSVPFATLAEVTFWRLSRNFNLDNKYLTLSTWCHVALRTGLLSDTVLKMKPLFLQRQIREPFTQTNCFFIFFQGRYASESYPSILLHDKKVYGFKGNLNLVLQAYARSLGNFLHCSWVFERAQHSWHCYKGNMANHHEKVNTGL